MKLTFVPIILNSNWNNMNSCPICNLAETKIVPLEAEDATLVECRRCGAFGITDAALTDLPDIFAKYQDGALRVGFALRRVTENRPGYVLTSEFLNLLASTALPTPPEQLEHLICFLGDSNFDAGVGIQLTPEHMSVVAARSYNSLGFIAEEAKNLKLIDGAILKHANQSDYVNLTYIRLTIDGWRTFIDLKKGKTEGRQAFMAMQFGESVLDDIYLNHFKKAVSEAGFELKRLDEGQPAGLIDDNLRVEIRKSKFLIADLTHHNNGAYWEAGYAEGLGKAVIYTCEKGVFKSKKRKTHFDTNHHLTVVWDYGNLEKAVKELKATIRATLPADAQMEDPVRFNRQPS